MSSLVLFLGTISCMLMKLHPPPAQMSFSHAACPPPHFLFFFFCIFSLFVISTFIPNFFFSSGKLYKAPLLLHIESVAFCLFFNRSFSGNTWERCVFSGFLLGLFRSDFFFLALAVHHLGLRRSFCLLILCDDRLKRFELILIKHWQRCREGSVLLGQFALNWQWFVYLFSGHTLITEAEWLFFLFSLSVVQIVFDQPYEHRVVCTFALLAKGCWCISS